MTGLDDGMRCSQIFISAIDGQFAGQRDILTRDTKELKAGAVTTSTSVTVATVDALGEVPAGQ